MRRFYEAVIACFVACFLGAIESQAQQRDIVWIGKHFGDNSYDRSELISSQLSFIPLFLPGELGMPEITQAWLRKLNYEVDPLTGVLPIDLVTRFSTDERSLMVLAGSGVGGDSQIVSLIYLGPATSRLRVEFARLKLLGEVNQPAGSRYLLLLLIYASIKESQDAGLDFRSVISPLRSIALELIPQARDVQTVIVDQIEAELLSLAP